jgi:hypothetical protein
LTPRRFWRETDNFEEVVLMPTGSSWSAVGINLVGNNIIMGKIGTTRYYLHVTTPELVTDATEHT